MPYALTSTCRPAPWCKSPLLPFPPTSAEPEAKTAYNSRKTKKRKKKPKVFSSSYSLPFPFAEPQAKAPGGGWGAKERGGKRENSSCCSYALVFLSAIALKSVIVAACCKIPVAAALRFVAA